MSTAELIERLTHLIELQAEIINEQAAALAQLDAVVAEEKVAAANAEREYLM